LLVSKAKVQLKSSIPICAKVEISPKSFKLGIKGEIEQIFSICPKLLINAEPYSLVLALRLKKRIPSNLERQFATLGANIPALINILKSMFLHLVELGAKHKPKMVQVGPSFSSPDS
jgi:hypothetical protein